MNTQGRQVRIVFLHHSTGEIVWQGGLQRYIRQWNSTHGTRFEISEMNYPAVLAGHTLLGKVLPGRIVQKLFPHFYPWANYPYDYWNLWVAHQGKQRDRGEFNLDDLVKDFDVIVFKHCFPVSRIEPDDGSPSVSSPKKTLANYKLQYEALKTRMRQFPDKRFIVWTGAALAQAATNVDEGERACQFASWVKDDWDEKGDNIFVWDFRALETEGGLFLKRDYESKPDNSHPSLVFGARVAPLIGRRIVDVIEGRGDTPTP